MNKIFKIVWNHSTQTWTVVSELAKGHTKSTTTNTNLENMAQTQPFSIKAIFKLSALTLGLVASMPNAYAALAIENPENVATPAIAGAWSNTTGAIATFKRDLAIGNGAKATGHSQPDDGVLRGSVAIGDGAIAQGSSGAVAIGSDARAIDNSTATPGSTSNGGQSVAIGSNASSGVKATAIGSDVQALGVSAVSIGYNSTALGINSIAFGNSAKVEKIGANSTAIGVGAIATVEDALALGKGAIANIEGSVALGEGSTTDIGDDYRIGEFRSTVGAFVYDSYAGIAPTSLVSIGSVGNERPIYNVAAGAIYKDSTQAVNGSQLYAVMDVLSNLGRSIHQIIGGSVRLKGNGELEAYDFADTGETSIGRAIIAARTKVHSTDGSVTVLGELMAVLIMI